MKKTTIPFLLLIVVLLGMTTVLLKQHKTMNGYTNGFPIKGTYIQSEGNSDVRLIFSDKNKVYSYQPFGKILEGTYAKTGDSNVYILKMNNHKTKYIVLRKNSLTCIDEENTATYRKESSGEIYDSVKHLE